MNSWLAPIQWLVFLVLCRMSYQAANIRSPTSPVQNYLIEKSSPDEAVTPREKEWADKAIRRYAAVQEKKWQRWNEAMFER